MSLNMSSQTMVWEVQQKVMGEWVNTIVKLDGAKPLGAQFDSREEAESELEALLKDVKESGVSGVDVSSYRVAQEWPHPAYSVGYRFQAYSQLLKRMSDFILSYRYHNGSVWKYHMGLVLGPVGSEIPSVYKHCQINVHDGSQYVDFTTVDEGDIEYLKRFGGM